MHNLTHIPWLTLLLAIPMAGALLCLVLARRPAACRWIALAATVAVFAVAAGLFIQGNAGMGWLWWEDAPWIGRWGIRYTVGMDGLSLLLVLLSACLLVLSVLISWREIDRHGPLYYALLLLLETGILGVFLALDLVLFYLFWEVMLIPMFLLIGIWGHERRLYAAVKFFLFTLAGSLLMLLAILGLYVLHGRQTGDWTFALAALQETAVPAGLAPWMFGAFLLAFAVKVPLVPVHTWLPDAHTEAPTAGSVILAGLLLKTGVYGLLRFGFPLFPEVALTSLPLLALLALIGIFYAAWIAYLQVDAKRLVAYSSVAHLGFVILGIAAWNVTALEGSILQMVNHGITTGALFALVGMIDARAGTRRLDGLGGLWARIPVLSAFFLFFCLASLGLPGLNNFAGEILILVGAFQARPIWGALGMAGVVFAAAYTLRLAQGVIWGEPRDKEPWPDMTVREGLVLVPLAVMVLWLGLYPAPFLEPLREPVQLLLDSLASAPKGGLP
ncbi:MAG: NADH-quinone oxidoreductase subunit M [Desulfuromonas sp.]|uniref:complex I subunit 4 family protein n=1 Tax=Desulfuromonas sp. TaxID=892 RepID=UPI000CB8D51A|nr:NADH-quinone oxidoreductase subunit M [Desulfuromonas sp.]PLX84259.1 MAG: NADH-quinone oxidoreductase subunit M [Desulfuromonas sp.]